MRRTGRFGRCRTWRVLRWQRHRDFGLGAERWEETHLP